MPRLGGWPWALGAATLLACREGAPADPTAEITALLTRSAGGWDRGAVAGFMSDYAPDSTLSYISGRGVQYGWQALYDRYERGYFRPGAARDSLSFTNLVVRALDDDLALATARFQLKTGGATVASGPFTLILEKRGARWLIIHDHSSSDPKP